MSFRNVYVVFVVAALAGAILLASRQRMLKELRTSNESLRQELATLSAASAVPDPGATNLVAPLTSEERSELLRLRGQIGPLRRELRALSNGPRK